MTMPNPLAYSGLKEWLGDLFAFLKKEKKITTREISRRANIAVGYLSMVMSGKRRLTRNAFDKILSAIEVSDEIRQYANDLFIVSESEIESERLKAYQRLLSAKKEPAQKEDETFQYLSEEALVELRELALLKGAGLDAEWYRSRLSKHYSLPEIKSKLKQLEKMGLLQKSETENKYVATQKNIECADGIFSLSLGAFHKRMLEEAIRSIGTSERSERHLEGYTFNLKEQDYAKAVDVLNDALEKIKKLEAQVGEGDRVFHFEAALFPLSKQSTESSESGGV